MHSLLERQLKKTGICGTQQSEEFQRLLSLVDAVYHQSDDDRRRIERSMEINSRELMLRNEQIAGLFRPVLKMPPNPRDVLETGQRL